MILKKKNSKYDNRMCYLQAINHIDLWDPITEEDKLRYYSFVIDRIKIAICAESHLDFILHQERNDNTKVWTYFPLYYYTNSLHSECIETDQKIICDFSKDILADSTFKGKSLIRHLEARAEDDFIGTSNHLAKFFSYIDMGVIYNGRHSAAAAMYYKKGSIKASLCDFPLLFSSTCTDGFEWYSNIAGKAMGQVVDYRYAVMYEIAKRRFRIDGHKYHIEEYSTVSP